MIYVFFYIDSFFIIIIIIKINFFDINREGRDRVSDSKISTLRLRRIAFVNEAITTLQKSSHTVLEHIDKSISFLDNFNSIIKYLDKE